jgi:hypothetical protein
LKARIFKILSLRQSVKYFVTKIEDIAVSKLCCVIEHDEQINCLIKEGCIAQLVAYPPTDP